MPSALTARPPFAHAHAYKDWCSVVHRVSGRTTADITCIACSKQCVWSIRPYATVFAAEAAKNTVLRRSWNESVRRGWGCTTAKAARSGSTGRKPSCAWFIVVLRHFGSGLQEMNCLACPPRSRKRAHACGLHMLRYSGKQSTAEYIVNRVKQLDGKSVEVNSTASTCYSPRLNS